MTLLQDMPGNGPPIRIVIFWRLSLRNGLLFTHLPLIIAIVPCSGMYDRALLMELECAQPDAVFMTIDCQSAIANPSSWHILYLPTLSGSCSDCVYKNLLKPCSHLFSTFTHLHSLLLPDLHLARKNQPTCLTLQSLKCCKRFREAHFIGYCEVVLAI